jgi:uncharacterized protein YdcH (DUF465 family)
MTDIHNCPIATELHENNEVINRLDEKNEKLKNKIKRLEELVQQAYKLSVAVTTILHLDTRLGKCLANFEAEHQKYLEME